MKMILRGRKVVPGTAEGVALVTKHPISFYFVDWSTGIVKERGHELEGKSVAGKILVFPKGKGSSAGTQTIYEMVKRKTAPVGMINISVEPIVTVGAILGNIPLMDRLEKNPLDTIETGDYVKIDADKGIVEVTKRSKS